MVRPARRMDAAAEGSHPPLRARGASDVPEVRAIIAAHSDPIARNEAFNAAYQVLANGLQDAIGRAPGTRPNWFAVGAHASPQVGRSMLAAHQTLRAIEMLRQEPAASRDRVFDELGLEGGIRRLAGAIATALDVVGPSGGATAIGCFVAISIATDRATSTRGLMDPRLAIAVAYRIHELARPPGSILGNAIAGLRGVLGLDPRAAEQLLHNVGRLARTYESLLAEGNRAIFADICGSAASFLRLRERRPDLEPEDVLSQLRLPESTASGSRRVYEHALEHAFDRSPPTDFSRLAPPGSGNDLVRAAMALYTLVGQTRDVDRKNAIVAHANNLIAWREQFETVQPAFEGTRSGELDRGRVLSALTPLVQVPFTGATWTFASFARRQHDRDGRVWTARASEYDWSKFPDRWPAILDAFELAYRNPQSVLRFPDPRL
jgi:hypothetical protein